MNEATQALINKLGPKRSAELNNMMKLYEDFHWGSKPTELLPIKIPSPLPPFVQLGIYPRVIYQTAKGEYHPMMWIHAFKRPFPLLVTDENHILHCVRGNYKITPEGVVG